MSLMTISDTDSRVINPMNYFYYLYFALLLYVPLLGYDFRFSYKAELVK